MKWRRWCLALVALLLVVVLTPTENGRWQCGLCGKHERRFDILGVTLSTSPIPSRYHDWFSSTIARAHEHDWVVVGCHKRGNLPLRIIACSMMRMKLLDAIAELPDGEKSKAAVDVLFSMSSEQRRDELRQFDGTDPTRTSPSYSSWWESHSRWQKAFPPPLPR